MFNLPGTDSESDFSDTGRGTPVQPKAPAALSTKPDPPFPVFGPPPKLGDGPTYDPTPDGSIPAFVPISMPTSLTRLEIGDIKPKYTPKLRDDHTYNLTPDGSIPAFVPISMLTSLTRLEIGDVKPKYTTKLGVKAYWTISAKGNGITTTITDQDGNIIVIVLHKLKLLRELYLYS
ncbi:MAG: hypothetical protein M1840_005952 [Geoglossum simile]|nr:MAG: hypothetical protein M1840_005952 [Geoglossum simile]